MKRRNLVNPHREAPNRCIYGVHPVIEWLRRRPHHLHAVHYDPQAADRIADVLRTATTAGVPMQACSESRLTAMVGSPRHQGVVATSAAFPYVQLDQVVATKPELLLLADQMQDPHNLGALLRTAEAVGAGGVIMPKDGAVPVTAAVEAASAGAAALLPVCRVTNAARTLRGLRACGYWIVGLVPRQGIDLFRFNAPKPIVIVVGGESGMRPLVARHCDVLVSIPMFGQIESLNASVAAAIAMYNLRRQWDGLTATGV